MPIYNMKAPNGKTYSIEGPDGATEDDVRAEILRRDPSAGTVATPAEHGISDLFKENLKEAQGNNPGLDPENQFGGPRVFDNGISNPLSTVADAADLIARGGEYLSAAGHTGLNLLDEAARSTGLAQLPQAIGLDKLMGNPGGEFLPGSAIGALGEAFPAGGMEAGIVHPAVSGRLSPAKEAEYLNIATHGSAQDILDFGAREGRPFDPAQVEQFIKDRDKAGGAAQNVTYTQQSELPLEAQPSLPFNGVTEADRALEAKLKGEVNRFLDNRPAEADVPDVRQRELPLEKPAHQQQLPLEEPTPKADVEATKKVDEVVNHINDLTKDWHNSPQFEVHKSFDDLDGIDNDAIGVTTPEGKVLINAKNINGPEDITAVAYHEALGHRGMSNVFGNSLDKTLTSFYDNSGWFREKVDQWVKDNPEAYSDRPDKLARAADEVFAEMSEAGDTSKEFLTLSNRIKNAVVGFARRVGINKEFSERELKTILAMAHDSVVSGKGYDVTANGFRYKLSDTNSELDDPAVLRTAELFGMPKERIPQALKEGDFRAQVAVTRHEMAKEAEGPRYKTRREQIKEATDKLSTVGKGETKTVQPFPEEEPNYYRFRHVTSDGKAVTGYYNVEDGKLQDFSVGSEAGPSAIGPKTIRQIGRDLLKEHPEASRISGYRISGARSTEQLVESGNRFMKKRPMKSTSPEGIKTERDTSDLNAFLRGQVEPLRTESVSDTDLRRAAEDFDLTTAKFLRGKSLKDQSVAAEIFAARRLYAKLENDLQGLADQAIEEGGTMSPSLYAKTRIKLNEAIAVRAKLEENISEAARALRANQIIADSMKSSKAMERYMQENMSSGNMLDNPESLTQFMRQLSKIKEVEGEGGITKALNAAKKTKADTYLYNALNLPRSLMSSMDLSAPFRQGVFLVGRKEFWKNLPGMFEQFASEPKFQASLKEIQNRPTYPLMEKSGLYIGETGAELAKREEQFMSQWAEKIPVAGKLVRASERAYTGFLNKLRADTFDSLVKLSQDAGIDLTLDDKTLKDMGGFINNATGRGDLGSLSQAGPMLNSLFFSPRLIASRISLLNPAYYMKLSPVVRKEAIKSLLSFGGIAMTVTMLAKMGGAEVEADPRSSDFGKLKYGNTRYDIGGGFNQYLTLGARLLTNQKKTLKGEVTDLGKKYGDPTRRDILVDFTSNKLAPIPSFLNDFLKGKDATGEPFDIKSSVAKRFIPMFAQDVYDVTKDNGPVGLAMAAPSILGVGVQDFASTAKETVTEKIAKDAGPTQQDMATELLKLEEENGKPLVNDVGGTLKADGKTIKLTPEEKQAYQDKSDEYLEKGLETLFAAPAWQTVDNDTKKEAIKELAAQSRALAREELFYNTEE